MWSNVFKKGLLYVHQLYDENGRLRPALYMTREFNLNFVQYNSLVVALPSKWKKYFKDKPKALYLPILPCNYKKLLNTKKKASAYAYQQLADNPFASVQKQQSWEAEFKTEFSYNEFCKACSNIYKVTNVTKYRSFQYRLMQRSVITVSKLYDWRVVDSNLCYYCHTQVETVQHLLFYCVEVQLLWTKVQEYICKRFRIVTEMNYKNVVLNQIHDASTSVANFICLVTKQYIYSQKCQKQALNFQQLESKIEMLERIEKYAQLSKIMQSRNTIRSGKLDRNQTTTQELSYVVVYRYRFNFYALPYSRF